MDHRFLIFSSSIATLHLIYNELRSIPAPPRSSLLYNRQFIDRLVDCINASSRSCSAAANELSLIAASWRSFRDVLLHLCGQTEPNSTAAAAADDDNDDETADWMGADKHTWAASPSAVVLAERILVQLVSATRPENCSLTRYLLHKLLPICAADADASEMAEITFDLPETVESKLEYCE